MPIDCFERLCDVYVYSCSAGRCNSLAILWFYIIYDQHDGAEVNHPIQIHIFWLLKFSANKPLKVFRHVSFDLIEQVLGPLIMRFLSYYLKMRSRQQAISHLRKSLSAQCLCVSIVHQKQSNIMLSLCPTRGFYLKQDARSRMDFDLYWLWLWPRVMTREGSIRRNSFSKL